MPLRKRQIKEPGHSRKILVISDNSPESECALRFAACRAEGTGGKVVMLRVIEPGDFQHWLGVEEIRRGEALAQAQAILRLHTRKMKSYSDIEPEHIIREGKTAEEIVGLIEEDPDIAILVLGASSDNEGPGPLVTSLANKGTAAFPIPVTIVPGTLTEEEIAALV